MKLLVLDSSGLVASVALIEDDQLIAEYTTGNKLTHSQTLLPMLDELADMIELDLNTLDAIAVAGGQRRDCGRPHRGRSDAQTHILLSAAKPPDAQCGKPGVRAAHLHRR